MWQELIAAYYLVVFIRLMFGHPLVVHKVYQYQVRFLDWLYGVSFADKTYSIKSWADQVVCSTGSCLIYGIHSSSIAGEDGSYTYGYGHFGLQKYTANKQVDLIQ